MAKEIIQIEVLGFFSGDFRIGYMTIHTSARTFNSIKTE